MQNPASFVHDSLNQLKPAEGTQAENRGTPKGQASGPGPPEDPRWGDVEFMAEDMELQKKMMGQLSLFLTRRDGRALSGLPSNSGNRSE